MHKLIFYGGKGHTEITWETEEAAAVREAQRIFEEALCKGGSAFRLSGGVDTAERITEFDPQAQEIAVVFPVAGGWTGV